MKIRNSFAAVLILIFTVIAGSGCSISLAKRHSVKTAKVAPDFNEWPRPYSRNILSIKDGREIYLLHQLFYKGDLGGEMEFVTLIYGENGPWLLVYDRENRVGIQGSGPIPAYRQLFVMKMKKIKHGQYGKWVFVKDFNNVGTDEGEFAFAKFLKEKYKLKRY